MFALTGYRRDGKIDLVIECNANEKGSAMRTLRANPNVVRVVTTVTIEDRAFSVDRKEEHDEIIAL